MISYTLYTPHDADDSTPTTHTSAQPVVVGDIIQVANGMWHRVDAAQMLRSGQLQLRLAQSACSAAEARLQLPT
jgi:hypothetical protein